MKIIILKQLLGSVLSTKHARAVVSYVEAKALYTYKNAKVLSSYARARFVRLYLDITAFFSRASFTDSQVKDIAKSTSDTLATLETVLKRTETTRQELAALVDQVSKLTGKSAQDYAAFADTRTHVVGKSAEDQATLVDDLTANISKTLSDLVYLTDDVGGLATVDDDQYMFLSKAVLELTTSISDLVLLTANYQRSFEDQSYSSDAQSLEIGKDLQDYPLFSDSKLFYLGKQLAQDYAAVVDQVYLSVQYLRSIVDEASAQDQAYRDISKVSSDSAVFSETFTVSQIIQRAIFEAVSAVEVVALLLYRTTTDQANFTESRTLLTGKTALDTLNAGDSGFLVAQGYVDNPFYFADDYVGAKRTF